MDEKTLWQLIGEALTIGSRGGLGPYLDSMYDSYPGFDYYRLAYVLARHMKPDIIVELGTQYARCTAHFAAGAPNARVVTIDHIDIRKQEKFEHDVRDHYPNIEFVIADSVDKEIVGNFEDRSISICLADTLHHESHGWREIQTWTPKMRIGGVWLIDDFRYCPKLFSRLPFTIKGIVKGLHTNPLEWPDQEFGYAIVE